jgi:translation initiation factor 3 subunit C
MFYNKLTADSDDEVRVVKSKKDKASDTILEIVNNIRNKRKVNDWSAIIDEFSKANEQVAKSVRLGLLPGPPKFYIRMLADLEDQVKETLKDKEAIKKMAKNSAKALDRMKLVIKKHNEGFKDEIADFRANPEKYEDDEEDSDDSSDEDSDESSDDSSDEDSDDSDSDSGSSDEEVKKKPTKAAAKKVRWDRDNV